MRRNASFIGSSQTPSITSATSSSGIFDIYDQQLYSRSSSWPNASLVVSPSLTTMNETNLAINTITVTANFFPVGTYYWTIEQISGTVIAADFSPASLSGSFSLSGSYASSSATFSIVASTDATADGTDTFYVAIRSSSATGPVIATSSTITLLDTSTTTPVGPSAISVLWIGNEYGGAIANVCSKLKIVNDAISPTYANSSSTFSAIENTGDITSAVAATNYDVLIWSNDYQGSTNTWQSINNFLAANKGFMIAVFGHTTWQSSTLYTNIGSSWQITTAGSWTTYNTTANFSGSHAIMTGCTAQDIVSGNYVNTSFSPVNGASIADTTNGGSYKMCTYKDYGALSRRADINAWPQGSWASNTITTGINRMIVNACYWAAKRVN